MANEFKIRNGFLSTGNSEVTGSLTVTAGITGSLHGTASWAENTITASFITASGVFGPYGSNSILTASYALTASYFSGSVSNATTASYALTASYFSGSISNAIYSETASYVNPLQQAVLITGSLNISGSIFNPNSIHFYTTASGVTQVGQLGWDDGYGTLDLMLKGGNVNVELGQENVVLVYNGNGTTLNKGEVVFVSGSQGNRPAVNRAIATTDGYSATTLGFAAEPIPAGSEGYVTTFGFINNINTTGTTGGTPVWLSPTTPGGWTTTKPQAPQHTVLLGYIVRVSNTVGSIFVHISNGWEIGELHDVKDTTTSSSYGDLLVKSGSVWITGRQLTGSYGLTGSLGQGLDVNASGSFSHAEGASTQAIGNASHAEGNSTIAFGNGSHAEGGNNIASGSYSHAEGDSTQAIGYAAHAEGDGTQAIGGYSHAEGASTQAIGDYSHTEGDSTFALGISSHTEGFNTVANREDYTTPYLSGSISYSGSGILYATGNVSSYPYGHYLAWYHGTDFVYYSSQISSSTYDAINGFTTINLITAPTTTDDTVGGGLIILQNTNDSSYSHAEGYQTVALGYASHAEGYSTIASGSYSHAEGDSTQAIGYAAHAEGDGTQAIGNSSHAEGKATTAIGDNSHAEGNSTQTGITTAYSASVSAGLVTLDASYGDISTDFSPGSLLYLYDAPFDFTYGAVTFTISSSTYTIQTEVQLTDVTAATTKAYVGDLSNIGTWSGDQTIPGSYSHAEGNGTQAIGDYSHAEGRVTAAIGGRSHAEGFSTKAIGQGSHAEGQNTQAQGDYSHAEGDGSQARGQYSHAEGQSTRAQGNYSHTEGRNTQAIGSYSHAEGIQTIASGSGQHVSGQFNTHGNTTSLVIIGNGVDNNNRSDLALFNTDGIQFTQPVTGSVFSGSFTGSLEGTASFATSASWAPSSGVTINNNTNNYLLTATGTANTINGESNLTFNGSTLEVIGNVKASSFSGSLAGTAISASFATTASFLLGSVTSASFASTASYVNGMITKNNAIANTSFTGTPRKTTVTFTTAFPNTNYTVTVTGEDSRTWTIESKLSGSFIISSNSSVALTGNTYWQAISYGEFNS